MLLTLSDGLFSYQTLTGTYTSGGILDLGWNAAHLCTGMAAVVQCLVAQGDPDFKDLHQRITRIGDKAHVVLPYFPYVWLIAAYLLLVNNYQIPMRMGFIPMAFCVGCIHHAGNCSPDNGPHGKSSTLLAGSGRHAAGSKPGA